MAGDCKCLWRDCECHERTWLWQCEPSLGQVLEWTPGCPEVRGTAETMEGTTGMQAAAIPKYFFSLLPAFKPRPAEPYKVASHSVIPEFEKS